MGVWGRGVAARPSTRQLWPRTILRVGGCHMKSLVLAHRRNENE